MNIHNQSLLYRNNCRTYWTQLVRTGSQHTLWVSGVGDLEAEPAPAPGLPATPLLPSLSKGTERTKSGWPRMSRAAHAPPGSLLLGPKVHRTCQASSRWESYTAGSGTVALGRPGASRGVTGPARLIARPPLTHPRPQPPRPAHNIRPGFRLRHPSRAKPRARSRAAPAAHAHMHRPQQAIAGRKPTPDSYQVVYLFCLMVHLFRPLPFLARP